MTGDLIDIDPEIIGGTPCIKGTRITVYAVAARIRAGETVGELFDGYPPEFNEAHVRTAIENADRVPFEVHPDGRPWRKAKAGAFIIAQMDRAQAWQLIRLALGFLELRLDPASYRVNRMIEVSTDGGIRPYDLARNDGNWRPSSPPAMDAPTGALYTCRMQ